MYVIVCLGNPGKEYSNTYHNMGFMVADKLSKFFDVKINKKKCDGLIGEGNYNGHKIVLVCPQTYMNNSGICVKKLVQFYKLDLQNLIVIYDDIDIALGEIRYRTSGSAGTHNGMRNVVNMLGTTDFKRIRIGIGKPEGNLIDYVLSQVSNKALELLEPAFDKVVDKVVEIINGHN